MMDEYLLLLLFLLFRSCVPEESQACNDVYVRDEDGAKLTFDMKRLSGMHLIPVFFDNTSKNVSQRFTPDTEIQILMNLCDTLIGSRICNTTGQACIFFSGEEGTGKAQTNVNDSIVLQSGSLTSLDFDLIDSSCQNNPSKKFIYHFYVRCRPFASITEEDHWAEWSDPESCEVNVYWTFGGNCGQYEEDYSCIVTLENNVTVDVSPLRNETFWSLEDPKRYVIYQFNICGPVKGGSCNGTFCDFYTERYPKGAVTMADTMNIYYNRLRGITISYRTKDLKTKVPIEVWLQCVSNHQDYKGPSVLPGAASETSKGQTRVLVMQTPIACAVPPAVCVAVDEHTGHHFNLYSLAGEILEFPYGPTKIIISVCGPIQKVHDKNVPCSGPGFASCHVHGKQVIRVLGMQQNRPPEVTPDGAIRIVYPNGDPCPYGGNRTRFTTFLDLYCDKNSVPNRVEGEACEIYVKFSTPAACQSMVQKI